MIGCHGLVPLPSRRFALLDAVEQQPSVAAGLVQRFGSPLNLIDPAPLIANHDELMSAATAAGVDLRVFYARKANKALALVDRALHHGLGIDVASTRELQQVLDAGATGDDCIVTAAVKDDELLRLAIDARAVVALDHQQEAQRWLTLASDQPEARAALRLCVALPGRPTSRFGLPPQAVLHAARLPGMEGRITGVQFHLDGYDAAERATAAAEAIALADTLRADGHPVSFIDIGGGVPMRYLDDDAGWQWFWREQRRALLDPEAPALTFRRHGLGLTAAAGQLVGQPAVYPAAQSPVRGPWLASILAAPAGPGESTIAAALRSRGLQLRCEPGRALLDGCGVTLARVSFTKPSGDDEAPTLAGLEMNRTQLRSNVDDFLVDPVLLRTGAQRSAATSGHLVGAYCIERELITWRTLRFPGGVAPGDVIAFPNTAGYLMHILESASHQLPLATNVIVDSADLEAGTRDRIDAVSPLRPS